MKQQHQLFNQDRAIESEATDQLDRGPFVDSLIRALVHGKFGTDEGKRIGRRSTGHVVGLTGSWGSGKSSILNLVNKKLSSTDHVIVALFNPWLFRGRDELVSGFFTELRGAMGRSGTEEANNMVEAINQYWGAINLAAHGVAAVVDVHGGSGAATTFWNTWGPKLREAAPEPKIKTPDEERSALEQKIADANCAVVVLIDELDRVEDDEVRAVAQLIKAVGEIKGLSYLVAYDPDRVIEALGRGTAATHRESGQKYIEKIIQHNIPIRPLFNEDVSILLESALADHDLAFKEKQNERQKKFLNHLIEEINTPREVKRLIGTYAILEQAVRGEICPYDVLGYCWILTKSPLLREEIASNIDKLVVDPGEQQMTELAIRRMNKEADPDFTALLGPEATAHTKTLKLLFPHIINPDNDDDFGERLAKRRNLVRMLYLGNPPGMVRRPMLEALWDNSNLDELEKALRQLMNDGKMREVVSRLDDFLLSLPESGDQTFWSALSRSFVRKSDWIDGPDSTRAFVDDAATSLFRIGHRDNEQRHRLQTAIDALIADGDLLLTPWLLRKHLFAFGLTVHDNNRRGGELLTLEETKALLSQEVPRYRRAILDGTFLRRLPDTEVIYVLSNSKNWDDELRDSLTEQIDSREAVATLAALLVPPGISTTPTVINEFFDVKVVRTRTTDWFNETGLPDNQWLSECIQRLLKLLEGTSVEYD